ncbi:MAG: hypothetical protein WC846_04060 [Candidatus Gracilibacteria bacterium]|jgi:hypothetical protein
MSTLETPLTAETPDDSGNENPQKRTPKPGDFVRFNAGIERRINSIVDDTVIFSPQAGINPIAISRLVLRKSTYGERIDYSWIIRED